MNDKKENWIALLERIENGTANDDDIQKYSNWCDSFQHKRDGETPVTLSKKQKEDLFFTISERTNNTPGRRIFPWKLISSVTAGVICFCMVGYWFYTNKKLNDKQLKESKIVSKENANVQGTLLVLDNGEQIELGKEKNGIISGTQDGNISKNSDSSLLYNARTDISKTTLVYNKLITSKGHQYQITLADGSKVWLNASSNLRFPVNFTGQNERRVFLDGEAYFEVAKNAKVPFYVQTVDQEIKVLGTHFNVKSDKGTSETATTLLEGAVRVNNAINLMPGEQLKITKSGMHKAKVDVMDAIAWKNGYFLFNGTALPEIMEELERWYDFEVEYNEAMPLVKIDANISRKKSLGQVLELLEMTGEVKFSRKGNKVVVGKIK
ncbi:MAG: FecR domain-containing protein [Sphingobacterium sp.]|jgi:hypothetical protein|nr:FecR domain-containing protein [Sphingobacterium sp.]